MKPTVLLITHSADEFGVDRVHAALERRGAKPLRVNTDQFPTSMELAFRVDGSGSSQWLEVEGQHLDLATVRACWQRKLWLAALPPELPEDQSRAIQRECMAVWTGIIRGMEHARWVNGVDAERRAEDKLWQLRAAQQVGLALPPTRITNSPDEVRAFYAEQQGRIITKMITPYQQSMDGGGAFVHTSRVGPEDLEALEGLWLCPMIFQAEIPKRVEHRVAVVGGRCLVGTIRSQQSAQGAVDWRQSEAGAWAWEVGELPPVVAEKLVALLRVLHIDSGMVDLIENLEGEYVFLEVNPSGEWGMMERDAGLPISEALADTLLERP